MSLRSLSSSQRSSNSHQGSSSSSRGALNNLNLADISLCGREKELEQLQMALDSTIANAANATAASLSSAAASTTGSSSRRNSTVTTTTTSSSTTSLVTISGVAGVGKTSLFLSKQDEWVINKPQQEQQRGCLFGTGVFPQQQQQGSSASAAASAASVPPLAAVKEAFSELIRQWSELPNSESEIKDFVAQAPKENEAMLRKVIPYVLDLYGIGDGGGNDDDATPKQRQRQSKRSLLFRNLFKRKSSSRSSKNSADTSATETTTTTTKDDNNDDTVGEEENSVPAVVDLEGCSSIQCYKSAMKRLLTYLCRPDRPVVLVLDNLHHADTTSLEIIQFLASCNDLPGALLLVLVYRDIEDQHHPVQSTLEAIEANTSCPIHRLTLEDLDLPAVNTILSKATGRDCETTMPLAEVIFQKTHGNPYHVLQFVHHLCDEGRLKFSLLDYRWEWDNVDCISSCMKVSANVSDLLASSMRRKLPPTTQQALMIASCLGDSIPHIVLEHFLDDLKQKEERKEEGGDNNEEDCAWLRMDSSLFTLDPGDVAASLKLAVDVGMLNYSSRTYVYTWSHEQLQQVAYDMLDPSVRGPLHARLGRTLWTLSTKDDSSSDDREWMIYMAADQFNRASQNFNTNCVSVQLATLNLQAAKLSMVNSAFYPARNMLQMGIERLDAKSQWADHYDLCLDLYNTLAEMEFALGDADAAMQAVTQVLENATSLGDKFRARIVQVQCVANGQDRNYKAGTECVISILAEYDVTIMQRPCAVTLAKENRKLREASKGQVGSIMDVPFMTDPTAKQIARFLLFLAKFSTMSSVTSGNPTLSQFASTRSLRHFYENGVTEETCYALVGHAMILKMHTEYKKCMEYAEVAEQLAQRFKSEGGVHAKVQGWIHGTIYPVLRPFHKSLEPMLDCYKLGLRTGDMESASLSAMGYSFLYLCIGLLLTPLESDVQSFGREARQFGRSKSLTVVFDIIQQTIANLQGDASSNPTMLIGEVMDQEEVLSAMEGEAQAMTLREVLTFQLMLACIYGDFKSAKPLVDQLSSYPFSDPSISRRHIRLTYLGLAAVAIGRERGWGKKCKYGRLGKKLIKLFQEETEMGSVNSYPVLQMLQAEENPSKELYDKAIKSCGRSGLIQHQAYMYERGGLYLSSQKDEAGAEFYLTQACALYNDWGAFGKVDKMKETYDFLSTRSSLSSSLASSSLKGVTRHRQSIFESLKTFSVSPTSPKKATVIPNPEGMGL